MLSRCCPICYSTDFRFRQTYQTSKNGTRSLFMCRKCRKSFSETSQTPMARLVTDLSTIEKALRARTDGLGFNACARVHSISRDTLRSWERRFAALKKDLYLYSLCHQFLSQTIEGDELYTKVGRNLPPSESQGWTVVLMDRASKFTWHMECGPRDKRLFKRAIQTLADVAKQTGQTTFIIRETMPRTP